MIDAPSRRIWFPIALWAGGILLALLASIFVGVYQHREFGTLYVFVKHRPAFKMFFFAPIGESDKKLSDLPAELQAEEVWYTTFVEHGRGCLRSLRVPFQ